MPKYIPTIGLEVHVELRTQTKMFCDCPNDSEEKHPNVNVCPICLGHPGALPTINKKAVAGVIKVGLALDGEINKQFKFDRKNYFYPDLPKGYQISQYDVPIVKGGYLDVPVGSEESKRIKIQRIHLEEDVGKLLHSANSKEQGVADNKERLAISNSQPATFVDFNRGGIPLMELVTEPDIHSVEEAVAFAKELQLILRYLEVSDADLEKGQMRVDANVSLSEVAGANREVRELGTKVEIKNLNSFRAIEASLNYEIQRQSEILETGKEIKQETRGWDDVRGKTIAQRSKEYAHDYRYFPEPDLPPIEISKFQDQELNLERIKLEIPELPQGKRRRFREQFKLAFQQANILAEDLEEAEYFEEAISELEADAETEITDKKTQLLLNYLNSDLKGLMKAREMDFKELKITPENFADLIEMIARNEISSRVAKDLLVKMIDAGVDPRTLMENEGLSLISGEEELGAVVKKILKNNSSAVSDYKKGKMNALQFLIGKAMAELKGRGNPQILKKLFEDYIKSND